jgi:hypothetical protein
VGKACRLHPLLLSLRAWPACRLSSSMCRPSYHVAVSQQFQPKHPPLIHFRSEATSLSPHFPPSATSYSNSRRAPFFQANSALAPFPFLGSPMSLTLFSLLGISGCHPQDSVLCAATLPRRPCGSALSLCLHIAPPFHGDHAVREFRGRCHRPPLLSYHGPVRFSPAWPNAQCNPTYTPTRPASDLAR